MPVISIIVPVYNAERYINRCIDSILSQTFADFELLLIDDGSTDQSSAICDEYALRDSRVRVFHKENGGVSSARNLGLDHAQGDFVGWVDSDDYIDPDMYRILYNSLQINNADIVYCNLYMDYGAQKELYKLTQSYKDKHSMLVGWIAEPWTICCTSLIKRNLYEDNCLRYPSDFNFCEDFWMSLELRLNAKQVVSLDNALYFYNRCNAVSITSRPKPVLQKDMEKAYTAIFSSLENKGLSNEYKKYLYWRILDTQQGWLMDKELFNNYLTFFPECVSELWSCPRVSLKRKVMIWCITHRLKYIAELMLLCYKIYK